MSSGEARRKAEIEAKRAKLAELRRLREEKSSRLQAGRGEGGSSSSNKGISEATTPASRHDLDDLVASLVGSSTHRTSTGSPRPVGRAYTPSSPYKNASTAGGCGAGSSEYGGSELGGPISVGTTLVHRADGEEQVGTSVRPVLVDSGAQTDLNDTVPKPPEKVYYTKETQTAVRVEENEAEDANRISEQAEKAIRAKVLHEQEQERLQREEQALKAQEEQLEREIEQGLRELSAEELGAIFGTPDFVHFVEQSSKIVERALTDNYDYLKDYTSTEDPLADQGQGRQVKQARTFWDEKLCKGRSITDIDWSARHPELVAVSYSRASPAVEDQPDGLVLVWNLHLADRPEFVFHASNDVLSVCISPFQPNLVIGGTYSGQILVWDTRARNVPILKTPLSAAGHTHPVYSMRIVGSQNAHNLITASTDGMVCSWVLDMLARPQETVELLNPGHPKTDEVSVTVIGMPDQETTSFWVGTEEGHVYSGTRYDRAGWKAGLNLAEVYRGHAAPITGLHFHPLVGPIDFSDLFLTSSMDWSTRLWRVKSNPASSSSTSTAATRTNATVTTSFVAPLASFEESNDYVYDVAWHTAHPAFFAQVDGTGSLDLYNLNLDLERPSVSIPVGHGRALNKVRWDRKDGRRLATGGADGRVYVYDVGTMAVPRDEEWIEFQKTVARLTVHVDAAGSMPGGSASTAAGNGSLNDAMTGLGNLSSMTTTHARTSVDLDRMAPRTAVR